MSRFRNNAFTLLFILSIISVLTLGGLFYTGKAKETEVPKKEIVLATTTSTEDSGLLDIIIPAFEREVQEKIKIKIVAVGTGQAIQLGKDGNADVLLVHAKKSEDEFVAQGFGSNDYDVMYNEFLIVGPEEDPANIGSAQTSVEAFKLIADSQSKFLSRGDDSGTHKKELSLWGKIETQLEDDWYISSGQGMGETLRMADEMSGYTLVDEATFLTTKSNLKVLFRGDEDLFNQYGIIQVSSTKNPNEANELISFFVSPKGQKIIEDFAKDKYGKSIFVPNAKKR